MASLARPGGNVTGLGMLSPEMRAKQVQLLKEILPRLTRVAFLRNPDIPLDVRELEVMARALGIRAQVVESMTREQLISEARRLRVGIRTHRDSTGHALCWHHPALWGLLPERTDPLPTVPTWPEFLRGCLQYRQSLDEQLPHAPRSDMPYRP